MSRFLDFNKFILDNNIHINNYINTLSHPSMVDLSVNLSKNLKLSSGIILDFGTNIHNLDLMTWALDSGHAICVTPISNICENFHKNILTSLKRFEELKQIANDYELNSLVSGGVLLRLKDEVDLDSLSNILFEHSFSGVYFNPEFFSNVNSLNYSLKLLELCKKHDVPLIVGETGGRDIGAYNIVDKAFSGIVTSGVNHNMVQPILELSDQIASDSFKIISKLYYFTEPQVMVKSFIAGASAVIIDLDNKNYTANQFVIEKICEEIKKGVYYAGYESLSDIVGTLDWSISV
jgi:hypothetical protein